MQYLDTILLAISLFVLPIVGFIVKNLHNRVDELERSKYMSEDEVRQIMADKIDPLREDIKEIKDKLNRTFDVIMQEHRTSHWT